MAHTDKDDPSWVRAHEHVVAFEAWHHSSCELGRYGSALRTCDLPEEPPTLHRPEDTWCTWQLSHFDDRTYREIVRRGSPTACDNKRCTHCKTKRTEVKRRRNNEKRELSRLIREELDDSFRP